MADEIAKDWPTLLTQARARCGGPLANFTYFYGRLQGVERASPLYGTPFFRAAEALAEGAVLAPSPVVRSALAALQPAATEIAASDDPALAAVEGQNLGALAVAALAEAAGWNGGPPPERPLDRLLTAPPQDQALARQTAWAALAAGRTAGLAEILRQDPAAAPPALGARFEGGVRPIQTHLARCLVHGGDPAAAWTAFRDGFAVNLAIHEASWPELLWAARAVHVALGAGDPAETLAWLRADIGA